MSLSQPCGACRIKASIGAMGAAGTSMKPWNDRTPSSKLIIVVVASWLLAPLLLGSAATGGQFAYLLGSACVVAYLAIFLSIIDYARQIGNDARTDEHNRLLRLGIIKEPPQPAVISVILEWFPLAPIILKPKRRLFESIGAAIHFAITELSEHDMPEIKTLDGNALGGWDYIEASCATMKVAGSNPANP
jgi:hypothetical protein